jgi:prolyl oligopeptidase
VAQSSIPILKLKGNTVGTYFGTSISDPYRWLEDDKSQTAACVKAQNKHYLSQIPYRDALKTDKKLWNYETRFSRRKLLYKMTD